MSISQAQSQSFIKMKPLMAHKDISRCPSTASTTTRSSSSQSNKSVIIKPKAKSTRITASSYCVYQMSTNTILGSKRDLELREIASLTKIMTSYTVLNLIESKMLGSMNDIVKISKSSANTTGTSADLLEGDEVTVRDLLYGLMLPSGNDAALALAEHFGKKIQGPNPVTNFIDEMNNNCKTLKLFYTNFANPHGLAIKRNLSCARDVCKMAAGAMKLMSFRIIVSTKTYTSCIKGSDGELRMKTWENTNKLLNKGFSGIKTGVTNKAGPCLCSSYENVIVTLLNSKSMEDRWREAEILVRLNK